MATSEDRTAKLLSLVSAARAAVVEALSSPVQPFNLGKAREYEDALSVAQSALRRASQAVREDEALAVDVQTADEINDTVAFTTTGMF